jgi:hypothetical protein
MSERFTPKIDILGYQEFVAETRNKFLDQYNWQDIYSDLIGDELMEVLYQHGTGSVLMMPINWDIPTLDSVNGDLRFHMADEMGDLLWFATDAADRLGVSVDEACKKSLLVNDINTNDPVISFEDIERVSLSSAEKISVPNKASLYFKNIPDELRKTSLVDNPNYVFIRYVNRLIRSLADHQYSLGPPTATELEPIQDISSTIGTLIFTMAYISKERLGISINDIARFNMAKLEHRKQYGKENDLVFGVSFLS